MTKKELKQYYYPGELLEAWLKKHNLTQTWLCRVMERPEKTISEIINHKASIVAKTAIELEKVTGIKAIHWLHLQDNLDMEPFYKPIDL